MDERLQKARHILATSTTRGTSHGELVVHTLLKERVLSDLNVEELQALAQGYNWWGRNDQALEAARLALQQQPENRALLNDVALHLANVCACETTETRLQAYDELLQEQLGPSWFWHLQKAHALMYYATGEDELEDYEWQPGDSLAHPEALDLALDELELSLNAPSNQRPDLQAWLALHKDVFGSSTRFHNLLDRIGEH